ncbi:hypothetical protein E4Z66_11525 [Aliishimia ponticola]|uniref:Uncharacterized protein n=1 Tax=Aliishimia ponticola TaxID=2499833 RepID=A0A4S4NCE5_9RHOB|nr:hypothetical protein [Aliishimia ponticola]THH35711.1 hypothetical protein E4Z66_11525 [Aliishimia ponticola]
MFDTTETYAAPPSALGELRTYVAEQREGLLNAASLLGGHPGARLAHSLIDGLAADAMPSRRTLEALDDLLDLLMLENVHDPERIEAACFALIDPASPVVEEICLLADGFQGAVGRFRDAEEAASAPAARKVAA